MLIYVTLVKDIFRILAFIKSMKLLLKKYNAIILIFSYKTCKVNAGFCPLVVFSINSTTCSFAILLKITSYSHAEIMACYIFTSFKCTKVARLFFVYLLCDANFKKFLFDHDFGIFFSLQTIYLYQTNKDRVEIQHFSIFVPSIYFEFIFRWTIQIYLSIEMIIMQKPI